MSGTSAVPKKRRSSAKQGKHRSHLALTPLKTVVDPKMGAIPRRISKAAKLGLVTLNRK